MERCGITILSRLTQPARRVQNKARKGSLETNNIKTTAESDPICSKDEVSDVRRVTDINRNILGRLQWKGCQRFVHVQTDLIVSYFCSYLTIPFDYSSLVTALIIVLKRFITQNYLCLILYNVSMHAFFFNWHFKINLILGFHEKSSHLHKGIKERESCLWYPVDAWSGMQWPENDGLGLAAALEARPGFQRRFQLTENN